MRHCSLWVFGTGLRDLWLWWPDLGFALEINSSSDVCI